MEFFRVESCAFRRLRFAAIFLDFFLAESPREALADFQQHFTLYQFITYAPFTFRGLNFLNLPSVSRFFLPFSSSSRRRHRFREKNMYIPGAVVSRCIKKTRLSQIYSYFKTKRNSAFNDPRRLFFTREMTRGEIFRAARDDQEKFTVALPCHISVTILLSFSPAVELSSKNFFRALLRTCTLILPILFVLIER